MKNMGKFGRCPTLMILSITIVSSLVMNTSWVRSSSYDEVLRELGLQRTECDDNIPLIRILIKESATSTSTSMVCANSNKSYDAGTYKLNSETWQLHLFDIQSNHHEANQDTHLKIPASMGGNLPALSPFFDMATGQPLKNSVILSELRSLFAGQGLSEANCGTQPNLVTVMINGRYQGCAYPNNRYSAGRYNLHINHLP